jgi:hypothetical protein
MNLAFRLGPHLVHVEAICMTRLHGGVVYTTYEYARDHLDSMSEEAFANFMAGLEKLWGRNRDWRVVRGVATVGQNASREKVKEALRLVVGAAWLKCWDTLSDPMASGSHAFVIWTQDPESEFSPARVLDETDWPSIAVDYHD